jgi:hypothetical protein
MHTARAARGYGATGAGARRAPRGRQGHAGRGRVAHAQHIEVKVHIGLVALPLWRALHERQRFDRPADKIARLKWIAANEAGLGRSEGLACLLVTLRKEGTSPGGKAGTMKLLAIWSQLYAQLAS